MKEKYNLIRGDRIIQQLNEITGAELQQRTNTFVPTTKNKRQYATGPLSIKTMQLIPLQGQRDDGQLKVEVQVQSQEKTYDAVILFSDVIYEEQDQSTNISFTSTNNKEYHILPIQLTKHNVQVRCNCLDFYFRFAYWNASKKGFYGNPFKPYRRKTQNYPSANPRKTPGVCKHLLKTIQELKSLGIVR